MQFTRSPDGIAGALKKIGGLPQGSVILDWHAEEASHIFISDSRYGRVRRALRGMTYFSFLETHPPLRDRIHRIEPRWNGRFPTEVLPR